MSASASASASVSASGRTDENKPWVEKYRPESFDGLISHQDILSTISRFIAQDRVPHMLFYGPPGTGKTTTVLAVARKLYGPRYSSQILELNASDERGIGVVRERIKQFAGTRTIFSTQTKLVVLDEADAMTSTAQAALRRVIEKYTRNARFVLICNYVSKIIPALQSRCTRFRFGPLDNEQMRSRLDEIVAKESVNIEPSGMDALVRLAAGDMRKSLNVLQSTSMAFDVVDEASVYACTGNPLPADIDGVVDAVLNKSFDEAYAAVRLLQQERGLALIDILHDVHHRLIRLDLPSRVRIDVLRALAEVEWQLSGGGSEKLQAGAFVAVFQKVRSQLQAASS